MKPMTKTVLRFVSLGLSLLMVMLLPTQILAAQENTPKEEVVYVNLNTDGSVSDIYVVNIFDLEQAGTILDYGAYESLRNMTGTGEVLYDNNMVQINADAGKLYYEGKLQSDQIPWIIDVRYYLDGVEISGEDLAGEDGALVITIDITRNEACTTNFFDGFALQVSLTLDTEKCSNIVAEKATVANVGSSKQLTHTIFPGKGAHLEISADVVDFEMSSIAINGLSLNLSMEIDESALVGQVEELLDAVAMLDDGASELRDGAESLLDGVEDGLTTGTDRLYEGAVELEKGVAALLDGGEALQDGAISLKDGAKTMDEGIATLHEGILKMQEALTTLNENSPALTEGSDTYLAGLQQLQDVLNNLSMSSDDLGALTEASTQVLDGLTELVTGAQALEENVSFAALKSIMAEHGLDVDELKANNTTAMELLRNAIDENQDFIALLEKWGFEVASLFEQLEQVILLLGANNSFIDGTELYLDTVNENLSTLAYGAATLQTNYALFDAEIEKLVVSLNSLIDNMGALTNAVNTLVTEYGKLDDGVDAYTGAVAEIVTAYSQIVNGSAALSAGSQTLVNGTAELYAGTGELLSGIVALSDGAGALSDGAEQLDSGATEVLDGIAKLYDGIAEMKDGTETFRNETDGLDSFVGDAIDEVLAGITGADVALESFVSPENENIDGVQFVIKTPAIAYTASVEQVDEVEQTLTFWQKLLKLFGLY